MDKELIKETIKEMFRDGELRLDVNVTDGSELYFQSSDEQTVRVEVRIVDSQNNELESASGDMTFKKQ